MIYLWFSPQFSNIGYIATNDFNEMYNFFKPDSRVYRASGLELNYIHMPENSTNFKLQCRKLYEESKESYTFNNWDAFWEWFFKKYAVDML